MTDWLPAAVVVVVAVLALRVGVGEDVEELVHPAARTATSITTANVPAKNDFFMLKPLNYSN